MNMLSLRFFPRPRRVGLLVVAIGLALGRPVGAGAGELKVDINRDSKNYDSVTETGFAKWSADTTGGAATGSTTITKTFTTATGEVVTVSFAQTALSQARGGTGLLSNWYQVGAQGTAKLVSDGLTVAPADFAGGGQIEMTITGLAAGRHTLLTYHNAWDALAPDSLGPIDIAVNGAPALAGLRPSVRAATNAAATIAYVAFEVAGPATTTTILFAARPDAEGAAVRNVPLNGFEIDTPNATRVAQTPSPADGDGHVDADAGGVVLSWSADLAGMAVSHDVYVGFEAAAVRAANRASPEFRGNQPLAATSFALTGLDSHRTYYWRVDEVDALGNATPGNLWSFRPRHLAFPGAEGWGRFARGGRDGRVVEVTSLADYLPSEAPIPGTLRWAVEEEVGPRTIVFAVGGLLTLRSRLTVADSFVTIAGQTAPGKGVCLRTWPLGLSGARDVVIRHLRSRPGRTLQTVMISEYADGRPGAPVSAEVAVAVDGLGMQGSEHCILDHCSVSWTIDEAFSSRAAKNITLQRTLISEALNKAKHPNYVFLDRLDGSEHGYAASIGGDIGSFHHNLLAHCHGRNWSLAGGLDAAGTFAGRLDLTNNVVYNWGHRTTDGGAMEVNFVANYYKPGPASDVFVALNAQYDAFPGMQRYFFAGNVMPGWFDETNQSAGRTASRGTGSLPTYENFVAIPFFASHVTTHSARDAFKHVLSDVGCTQPAIDDHDARMIVETRDGTFAYRGSVTGKPGLPDNEADVGGWENYPAVRRPADWDTDHDGLPNWWERVRGLAPASAVGDFSDANRDLDRDGYTELDDYLAWMAAPHFDCPAGGTVDIDLAALARGFTAAPQFAVSDAVSGTVQFLGDGRTARFTAGAADEVLGGFRLTVTDAENATLVRAVGIRVVPATVRPALDQSPLNTTVRAGVEGRLIATASGAAPLRFDWFKDGQLVSGGNDGVLSRTVVAPADAGFYDVIVTDGTGASVLSRPAILGVLPAAGARTAGSVETRAEWQDIRHLNGATYDQFLLTGVAGTFTADPGEIARMSFLDPNDSIVQVEMSGAGAITVVLADPQGPVPPALYNQSGIAYMKGKPTVILAGADESTHFTIYSVGTATNPGVTRPEVNYAGWAEVAAAGILSTDGRLGGIHQGNVLYRSATGYTGVLAPEVGALGSLGVVHEIAASGTALPYLYFGAGGTVTLKIAGGTLAQPNGEWLTVRGLARLQLGAGQDSCGRGAPAGAIRGDLVDDAGTNVTAAVVEGP